MLISIWLVFVCASVQARCVVYVVYVVYVVRARARVFVMYVVRARARVFT